MGFLGLLTGLDGISVPLHILSVVMIPLPGILTGCLALAASSSSSSSSKFPPTSLDGRFQHCKAGITTTSTGTSFPSWLEENFRRSGLAIADFALDQKKNPFQDVTFLVYFSSVFLQ